MTLPTSVRQAIMAAACGACERRDLLETIMCPDCRTKRLIYYPLVMGVRDEGRFFVRHRHQWVCDSCGRRYSVYDLLIKAGRGRLETGNVLTVVSGGRK